MNVLSNRNVWVEELDIENFLSLENVNVELGKLTVLVGLNASGKSNVVKALTLLNKLKENDIRTMCNVNLKMELIEQLFHTLERNLKLGVRMKVDGEELSYETSIDPRRFIAKEIIMLETKNLLTRNENGRVEFLTGSEQGESYNVNLESSIFRSFTERFHPLIRKVMDVLGNIRTYSFNPDEIRSVASSGFKLKLERNGSNLAQVLHTLLTYDRKKFQTVEGIMRDLIPEIEEINVPTTESGDQVYLVMKERGISKPLKYSNISDGTLRILAFTTALYLEGTVIAFEEPENCVHPYLFETVVDLCKKAPCQVIITTHSPYLVNQVPPEELRLVEKTGGDTTIRKVEDKEKVKRMLEEGLTLGEVWYSGELEEFHEQDSGSS